MNERDDESFVKEEITGRKSGPGRMLLRLVSVIFYGFVFGITAALAFSTLLPRAVDYIKRQNAEKIIIETDSSEDSEASEENEESGEEDNKKEGKDTSEDKSEKNSSIKESGNSEIEESENQEIKENGNPEIKENGRSQINESIKNSEDETGIKEAIENIDTTELFRGFSQDLRRIYQQADYSLVELQKAVPGRDIFGEYKKESVFPGIIIAVTDDEVLIFSPLEDLAGEEEIEAVFDRSFSHEAYIKGSSKKDRMMVLACDISEFSDDEKEKIKSIDYGNSSFIKRGDMLLGIGNPSGEMYSCDSTEVSFVGFNADGTDETRELLTVKDVVSTDNTVFYINLSGELVGWRFPGGDSESSDGFTNIECISDRLKSIEMLSNGGKIAYLGIVPQDVTVDMEKKGIPKGVYVKECLSDGPAFLSGLKKGDIITRINNESIKGIYDYSKALMGISPGDDFDISFLRETGDGFREISLQAAAGER